MTRHVRILLVTYWEIRILLLTGITWDETLKFNSNKQLLPQILLEASYFAQNVMKILCFVFLANFHLIKEFVLQIVAVLCLASVALAQYGGLGYGGGHEHHEDHYVS